MNIKQFLKPNWRKFVIMGILTMILFLSAMLVSAADNPQIEGYLNIPEVVVLVFFAVVIVLFPFSELTYFPDFLALTFIIIYWYFLSCLIVWIYDKVKKK